MRRFIASVTRPIVDIDLALHGLLTDALDGTGVRVDSTFPGPDRLPAIVHGRVAGIEDFPAGAVDRPRVDFDAYAPRRQQAIILVTDVIAWLHSQEGRIVLMGDGTRFLIATVDQQAGLITGQDDETAQGIWRATVSLDFTIHQLTPELIAP